MLYISSGQSLLRVLPGQILSITTEPNAAYQIFLEPNATTSAPVSSAVRKGDSLIVNYADGTSIVMENYFINCVGENACRLVLDNQELDTLLSLNIEEAIIDKPLQPDAEANIFMAENTTNYSEILDQSIRNNQLDKADFPAGTLTSDISNTKNLIEEQQNTVETRSLSLNIDIADDILTTNETTLITFTFTQPPVDFTLADINADNAILSNLTVTVDPRIYTATLTPTIHLLDDTNRITVSATYTDILGNIGDETFSANYVIDNNYLPMITDAGSILSYTEGDGAQIINASLNLSDVDDSQIIRASITIDGGFNSGEDQLSFVDTTGITGSYNATAGVLSLSGIATLSEYQSALQSITYTNTNTLNPSDNSRTISWVVNDGISDSIAVTSTINISPINSIPLLFSGQQQMAFDGSDDYLTIPTILQNEGLHDSSGNFLGMSIAASVTMDTFNFFNRIIDLSEGGANNDNIYISNKHYTSTLRYEIHDGTNSYAVDVHNFFTLGENVDLVINHASDGIVTIYRNGIEIDRNVHSITINNSPAPDPIIVATPANVTRSTNLIGKSHAAGTQFFEGSMDNISLVARTLSESEITTLASGDYSGLNQDSATIFNYTFDGNNPLTDQGVNQNDVTTSGSPQTVSSAVNFTIGGPARIIGEQLLLKDEDSSLLSSATISITAGLTSSEDALCFIDTDNITGSYNTSTGVLTLTGIASIEQYQYALRSVTYSNSNNVTPTASDRVISWYINDGVDDSLSVSTTVTFVDLFTEISLSADAAKSSTSQGTGSIEKTLNDSFSYDISSPTSPSPIQSYNINNDGFHAAQTSGIDAELYYDLDTVYVQDAAINSFIIDLYGRDSDLDRDDDFDILFYDNNANLLGSISNLAIPDSTHLRVNVTASLPALTDGTTISAFKIIGHDTNLGDAANYFTLMEIRAAQQINDPNEIALTAVTSGSSISVLNGSIENTVNDTFNYQSLYPTSPAPDQAYFGDAGFHADESEGTDVILNYNLNTQYTQSANDNAFVIDVYGRDDLFSRDNDFDIQIFDASATLLGTIEHLAIPDNTQAHLRVNVTQALAGTINGADTIASFRIIGHDADLSNTNNYFTLMEVRAAELNLATPIILDLDGDGIETTSLQAGVIFDIDGDGHKEQSAWVGADDALLVRDINGDGQINDASELFGVATTLADGSTATDGYAALADLDTNNDDVLNAFDTLFNELQIWQDINSDAMVQEGELSYLKESNVAELNLLATDSNEWQNSNLIGKQSLWTDTSGDIHNMADVWLNYTAIDEQLLSQIAVDLSVTEKSEVLLPSQNTQSTETAASTKTQYNGTDSSKGLDNTIAIYDAADTSASDEALRNASIVL